MFLPPCPTFSAQVSQYFTQENPGTEILKDQKNLHLMLFQ